MSTERRLEFFGGGWRQVEPSTAEKLSPVVDVHGHVFRRLGTKSDEEGAETSLRLWQYHLRDFTDFWRKSDRVRVKQQLLEYPSDDIREMPDVGFRMGGHGQAEVTIDGVDYCLQMYPPSMANMDCPPEWMVAEMDVAGVDMAVLQSDHVYGERINDYYEQALGAFPGRFIPLAQIWEPDGGSPEQLERLTYAVQEQSCRGLYFSAELFALDGYVHQIDDAKFEPLWDRVVQLGVPVFWYLDPRKRNRVGSFMECLVRANRWAEVHPDIPAVLTHGPVPATLIHEIGIPDELWTLLRRPNWHVEMLIQAKYPEYPYPEGQQLLSRFRDEIGIEKLLWGSDMPYGGMWCTYRQAVNFVRLHCECLSPKEKALFLGGNVARLLKVDSPPLGGPRA